MTCCKKTNRNLLIVILILIAVLIILLVMFVIIPMIIFQYKINKIRNIVMPYKESAEKIIASGQKILKNVDKFVESANPAIQGMLQT